MRKVTILGLSTLLALGSLSRATPSAQRLVEPNFLPMLVASYAYALASGAENRTNAVNPESSLGRDYAALEKGLENLHAEVPTKIAFVRELRLLDLTLAGSRAVGSREKGTLYIVGPIAKLGNVVLVIVSGVSPDSTTIFTIDERLNAKLVYDSTARDFGAASIACGPVGTIYEMEGTAAGNISLHEMNARYSAKHERNFALELNGNPKIACAANAVQ